MGIAQNHPRRTLKVLYFNIHQNVSWHLKTPEVREDGNPAAASREGSSTGKQMPPPIPEDDIEITKERPPTTQ